jgi:hypothetical protein
MISSCYYPAFTALSNIYSYTASACGEAHTVEGLQVKWRRSLGEVKGRLLQAGEA